MVNGIPTVYCFHISCRNAVAAVNLQLRRTVARIQFPNLFNQSGGGELQRALMRKKEQNLKQRAQVAAARIFAQCQSEIADVFESSPVRLDCSPEDDWRFLLRLFAPNDVVWIGATTDSCDSTANEMRKRICRKHFRPVEEWLRVSHPPGQFICPNTFNEGVHSRSNQNVSRHVFLVVESDILSKVQMFAVFAWMRRFMHLRAIVDTAGKSVHGWFEYPNELQLAELRVILPALGCDPALFKSSQPCRLPGALRDGKLQRLLWFDLEGKS